MTVKRVLSTLALVAVLVAVLVTMGRHWWCSCGQAFLWSRDVTGQHNSQHLADAYSGSHLQHGLLFYLIFFKLRPRSSRWSRFNMAFVLESAWEIWENTPFIINRYRQDTASLDYVGDTIANSLGDLSSCALGFALAAWLPVVASVLLYVSVEGLMLWLIRDSLTLNVWMLIAPNEAIKAWQQR